MKQLKDYNDSLKEQLRYAESEGTHEEQEGSEVASEALEHFKSAVYFPANEALSLKENCPQQQRFVRDSVGKERSHLVLHRCYENAVLC